MKPLFFNLLIIVLFSSISLNGQSLKVYNDLFTPAKTIDAANSRNAAINYLEINKKSVKDLFKAADKSCVMSLPYSNNKTITLELIETNIFTDDFIITNANDQIINLNKGRHFQGKIRGEETSFVAFSVFEDQIFGLMSDKSGNYNLGKVKNSEQYAFYNSSESGFDINHACHMVDTRPEHDIPFQETIETRNAKTVKLYAEVDNDIVAAMGGVTQATNYVTAMYNQFILLYAQDGITFKLSGLKVWNTASPYFVTAGVDDTEDYLVEFQSKSDGFNGNVAQLLTFQEINGGLATGFHGLCASNPDSSKCVLQIYGTFENVPTYSWDVAVAAHEVGHLLGSRHTHACVWNGNNTAIDGCAGYIEGECVLPGFPAGGGTIMSYCDNTDVGVNLTLGFGPQPLAYILNRINNASCLDGGSGTLSVDPQFVEIPTSGDCKSINVTATGAWAAEYDQDYPPFFITNPSNITGNGNASIELCASKNTLPVPFYTILYVYNGTTEIPVIIRQDSVHEPTAVFYPGNEKISPFSGETFSLDILTNTDWKLTQNEYDQKWVIIKSSKSGTKNAEFTVEVKKNTTPLNRYSRITMIYNNGLDTTYFTISQPSENSGYLNVPAEFTASKTGNSYSFKVYSDLDWEITEKPAWVTEITPIKGKKDQIVVVTIDENLTQNERFGSITFVAQTITKDSIVKVVNINQLDERSGNSDLTDRIYPNPTRDELTIELSAETEEKLDVRIFDAAGRMIKIFEQNKPVFGAFYKTYQVSDLAPGFYTMDIRHGSSILKEKLVILN